MASGRPAAAPNAQAARISGAAFALGGAAVVVAGVASILTGKPGAAHDLAPLSAPADIVGRFGEVAPVLSAALAAVVVMTVVVLMARGLLASQAAALELLILGVVIDVCLGGAAGRIGHAADGGVLGSSIACLMGGTAVVAGGLIALLGREKAAR